MNHRFNKRRSCSDEGVGEPSKVLKFQMPSSSTSSRSGKHNSNLRQARMIYPFCMVPQRGIISAPQNNFVSPQMYAPSLPQPYVTDSSICFTLLPFRNDLNYQFSLQTGPGQSIYATSGSENPIMFPISFALNRIPFINVKLPVDLTSAIQNGSNLISFQQINSTQPVFITICMSPSPQIDELIDKVINEFPRAVSLNAQFNSIGVLPFPNDSDPITGNQISLPCRGANCTHFQCFDLRSFIERALNENSWNCPVCGLALSYENLRYDPTFYDLIFQLQQQQQMQQMQQMNPFGSMNMYKPMNHNNNFVYNTPMSAPSQTQMPFSMSSSVSESCSVSTQSDDNPQHAQIQQTLPPPAQPPQENSIFDDFNISVDPFNDDFGFNFF